MDGPLYAILVVFAFVVGGLFVCLYVETSNAHEIKIECIKSGGEVIQDSCIRQRPAKP